MSALAGTESRFQACVLGGNREIAAEIAGEDEAFRQARLDIYCDAYRLRLTEALATDYAVLKTCVGDSVFEALARDYLAAHPSVFRNVRWFGGQLADFLRSDSRYAGQPVLADLAQFEWTLGLAFDAADETAVRFEEVAAVPPQAWAGLRFAPHPALHVLTLRTNAVALWNEVKNSGSAIAPENLAESVRWAVWRKDYSPYFRSLQADEAWALEAMRSGAVFTEICAGLCQWVAPADAALRAAGLLRGWVDEGWIARLETGA